MMNRSNLPETAPDGYSSNYAAIRDLLRFGPGIMTLTEFAVLLFHAERSTVAGRFSDQHSQRDALRGMYSPGLGRWVRGPAGVGKGTWVRANAALVRHGFLKSYQRWNWHQKNDPTEYEIVWPAISRAIDGWKQRQSEELGLFNIEPEKKREA